MLLVWDENAWQDSCGGKPRTAGPQGGSTRCSWTSNANGSPGIGKPEALKHSCAGYWSRRITDEHRLVDKIVGEDVRIAACRYHCGEARNVECISSLRARQAAEGPTSMRLTLVQGPPWGR